MVICLERGADLHMAQLVPRHSLSCFSKIHIGFTFLVPAHLRSPGKGLLNGCVCVCVMRRLSWYLTSFYSQQDPGQNNPEQADAICRRTWHSARKPMRVPVRPWYS